MLEQVKKTARQITAPPPAPVASNSGEEQNSDDDDDNLIGPSIPKTSIDATKTKPKKSDNEDSTDSDSDKDSDDDEDDNEDSILNRIPASHEVSMTHGTKAVTAISSDPSGARLGKTQKYK